MGGAFGNRPVTEIPPQIEVDQDFTSGESPIDIDIEGLLGKKANAGQLYNLGPGNLDVEFSSDGTNFSGATPLLNGETFQISGLNVKILRIALEDATKPSGYRVIAADPGQEVIVASGVHINSARASAPERSTGAKETSVSILAATAGNRRAIALSNNGGKEVFLAFDGETADEFFGIKLVEEDGSLMLDAALTGNGEIQAWSRDPLDIGIQVWEH